VYRVVAATLDHEATNKRMKCHHMDDDRRWSHFLRSKPQDKIGNLRKGRTGSAWKQGV
jgi:hypothetical protein